MPSSIGVVGVSKTSFVLALGAKEVDASVTNASPQYLWPRPGGNGRKKTTVHVLRGREEVSDGDDGVFVLLFDLTRRESLAAVIAQWAHLSDAPGRRLLLVGTHADCKSKRQVSVSEVREISGEFHAYEEVCCRPGHSGDEGMLRVQVVLAQWTSAGPDVMVSDIPLARASICGYPRPVVTMMTSASHSLPASPAGQQRPRMRADVWLYDPAEQVSSSPVTTSVGGDVKLRTISKAIYDIRGAVAEKSRSLAKYRDRQMSHWLTRSRYFGPTESSRHKRWQEEQKRRQQQQQQPTQGHVHHHHHTNQVRNPSGTSDGLQQQRIRSVSHPEKVQPPRKPTTRRGPAQSSSSSSSENEESPGTLLERKSFMQPTELVKQRQRQLEADAARQHKKMVAQRTLRMQRRAASNDLYERSTASAAAFESYLNCYDEMDMPPQLQPLSPSLNRRAPSSLPSPASSVASSSSSRRHQGDGVGQQQQLFEDDGLEGVDCSLELLSPGTEQVGCLPTPLPTTHLQSPVPPMMIPPAPSSVRSHRSNNSVDSAEEALLSDTVLTLTTPDKPRSSQPSSVQSHHSSNSCDSAEEALLSDTVLQQPTPDKANTASKSSEPSPPSATAVAKHTQPTASVTGDTAISRTNTMCSSSSENFDCSDIDDMLEYFEGVTLPI